MRKKQEGVYGLLPQGAPDVPEPPAPLAAFTRVPKKGDRTTRARTPSPSAGRAASPKPTGRRPLPDPKFADGGCWYCESKDHKQGDCPKSKADKAKTWAKHLDGAWEKKNTVKAAPVIATGEDTEDDSDDDSVQAAPMLAKKVLSWPLLCAAPDISTGGCVSFKPRETSIDLNINDSELRAEDRKILAELSSWAKVTRKKSTKGTTPYKRWLAEVAVAALDCPDIFMEEDDIWCMVDSGCGDHCADPDSHFMQVTMRPSKGSKRGRVFSTATKEELPNLGEREVHFSTEEGNEGNVAFQMCKGIAMPILSVRKLAKTNEIRFLDKENGQIISKATGLVTNFISMYGVYFVKLKVKRSAEVEPTFGRPA